MLLQSTISISTPISNNKNPNFPQSFSNSLHFPSGFCSKSIISPISAHNLPKIKCFSVSQAYSYGTVDYEKRPVVKWKELYKMISLMDLDKDAVEVLSQWENEGRKLTKWELCRVVKELRKFRKYKFALEIYDWMNNREERFRINTSDTAIHLDLVGKVNGISSAEDFFMKLPNALKDKRTYGALLNSYARAKMRGSAESILNQMKEMGYASHALPFNVMMTLYMNLKDHDKVERVVSEMKERRIPLDLYSYNIWLSSRGAQGNTEKVEQIIAQMNMDQTININWTTYSTMATMYIKLGQLDKAVDCLKKIEGRITGRDRVPYHYLISLYGSAGMKEEVRRIWDSYKAVFPFIPNMGYHAVISSFIKLNDIEEAENIYEEWLSVKSTFDPRIANFILRWYVRNGLLEKANTFFREMGGKPNSGSWEILAEGCIAERRISDALSHLEKAVLAEGSSFWKPRPSNVATILRVCEEDGDTANKEVLFKVLRDVGCLEDEEYMSHVPSSLTSDNEFVESDGEREEMLNELQASL